MELFLHYNEITCTSIQYGYICIHNLHYCDNSVISII